jgi:hypothetical protein
MLGLMGTGRLMTGARALCAAGLAIAGCAIAASSSAATPPGEYAVFAQCPIHAVPRVSGCLTINLESGVVTAGRLSAQLPAEIQGGTRNVGDNVKQMEGALDGETFTEAAAPLPSGVAPVNCGAVRGFARWVCEELARHISAVVELAGPASSVELVAGFFEFNGLVFPAKIRLEGPLLGADCYVGSEANPILLRLTTGATSPPPPAKSISGTQGHISTKAEGGGILAYSQMSAVDNAFAAPAATGCGGTLAPVIDPLLDASLGLPSPAGHNLAILNGTLEVTSAASVEESEE